MLKSGKFSLLIPALFLVYGIVAQGCTREKMRYRHFSGESSDLNVLLSDEVLFLYPDESFNTDSLLLLLETYNKAYRLAVEITGREPLSAPIDTDKLPLAIVPSTCGAGCGRLGQKGIEITEFMFEMIYSEFVINKRHDHLFFYELGRNFWFYGNGIDKVELEEIHTGFAVFFRDLLVHELDLTIAPINGVNYLEYFEEKQSRFDDFMAKIEPDQNLCEIDRSMINFYFPSVPIFWSSLWSKLYQKRGLEGIQEALGQIPERILVQCEKDWLLFLCD